MTEQQHHIVALDWVKGEIEETLRQARQALEAYVENSGDSTRLRFCLAYLHQIHGTLQMVELYGAALLAEEMEALCLALLEGQVSKVEDGHEVLMRAMLQVPAYLDRIKSSGRDMPMVLMDLLNDLRRARNEPLLTETALFKPDLASARRDLPAHTGVRPDLGQQVQLRRLRHAYQMALLDTLRRAPGDRHLQSMLKVFDHLGRLSARSGADELWEVAGALVEALNGRGVDLSATVKALLGQTDRQIKRFIEEGGFTPPQDLLKNILYFVAKAQTGTPRIDTVRQRYRLSESLPSEAHLDAERARMAGPDGEALRSVVEALSEELARVKDTLDVFVRSAQRNNTELEALTPTLRQVADTIGVLGLGQQRRIVLDQIEVIEHIVQDGHVDEGRLMDVAGALLFVEASLHGYVQEQVGVGLRLDDLMHQDMRAELSEAQEAVLRESRSALEQAKDAVIAYINAQWNASHIQPLPGLFAGVRGGLEILGLHRPAGLLNILGHYVQERLLSDAPRPDWSEMDTLADAIAGIEYYLEHLAHGGGENPAPLDMAEKALSHLHIQPMLSETTEAVELSSDSAPDLAIEADREPDAWEDLDVPSEITQQSTESMEAQLQALLPEHDEALPSTGELPDEFEPEPLTAEPHDASAADEALLKAVELPDEIKLEEVAEFEPEPLTAEPHDAITADEALLSADERADEVELEAAAAPAPAVMGGGIINTAPTSKPMVPVLIEMPVDDFDADEEIRDIFIEEAEEVLQSIAEYFPQWAADFSDVAALKEFRRGFHTLKGSGRMVGARVIGELSWSIENMLNRIMDGALPPTQVMVHLISEVLAVIPPLVESYRQGVAPEVDTGPLMRSALALTRGEALDPVQLASAVDSAVSSEADDDEAVIEAAAVVPDDLELAPLPDMPDVSDVSLPAIPAIPAIPEMVLDPLLLEIFVSEASTHLDTLQGFLQQDDTSHPSDALLRALHTLKGSSAMANVAAIAALSAPLEALFKNMRNFNHTLDLRHIGVLQDYRVMLASGIEQLRQGEMPQLADADLLARIHALDGEASIQADLANESAGHDGSPVTRLLAASIEHILDAPDELGRWLDSADVEDTYLQLMSELDRMAAVAEDLQLSPLAALTQVLARLYERLHAGQLQLDATLRGHLIEAHDQIIDMMDALAANIEIVAPLVLQDVLEELVGLAIEGDGELLELFIAEAQERLRALQVQVQSRQAEEIAAALTALPELAESAHLAGVESVAELARALQSVLQAIHEERIASSPEAWEVLDLAVQQMGQMLKELEQHGHGYAAQDVLRRLAALIEVRPTLLRNSIATPAPVAVTSAVVPAYDSELLEIFLEEAEELLDSSAADLQAWRQAPENLLPVQQLQRALHTLKGGARMAEITPLGDLAHEMEFLFERLADGRLQPHAALQRLLDRCQDRLADALTQLRAQQSCPSTADLITMLRSYIDDPDNFEEQAPAVTLTPVVPEAVTSASIDPEILQYFTEESSELSSAIDASLSRLMDVPDDAVERSLLMRHLHTIKGGARLAELGEIGDHVHAWESELLAARVQERDGTSTFWQVQLERQASLQSLLARLGGSAPQTVPMMPEPLPALADVDEAAVTPAPQADRREEAPSLPVLHERPQDLGLVNPPPMLRHAQGDAARGPQELVRVSADLLEKLVNLAGETSIARGRVEQGVMNFQQSVEEMGTTVQRLAEQLRRMDIELETQIRARHSHEIEGKYEEFDPLEMDQYSALNQLSKALSESASDLVDIKSTLLERARDAETLLLQQSRINTELQEGLMRTRMVPFSRLVPRLRRIVRQTGQEVGKLADLEVLNPEGEMDRSLLERIVAPLEHMLRNAVDHGIEEPARRQEQGKPEEGKVILTLSREGGEVVLTLSDDGRGIALESVRTKAIERGLMRADEQLSDDELMQFIFHAGFSTAAAVTQISGRGVGMDVVQSEIKQMGGSVEIRSQSGQGTTFIVRLPFTVSVNRALMVRSGEDIYAVPLQQVEGIVRASPAELESYYAPDAPLFEYAQVAYQLHYLGEFVHGHRKPNLVGQQMPLPVLLVRGGDQRRIAVQVDGLMGSREVVVKSVGAQLASVAGISGATILGDGSVVIILDLQAMLRASLLTLRLRGSVAPADLPTPALPAAPQESLALKMRTVMVVDDSVTVRKVTSRLLERHGYRVLLAKDGMDAIARLEDITPDIMLLDIEMPRMDGFEVAALVRHNPRLEKLPIIMITSRTGEKHRERAFAIGVDAYMGKPFVDQKLLETLQELLERN